MTTACGALRTTTGTVTVLADKWQGQLFERAERRRGASRWGIWFTDPGYAAC